MAAVARTCQVLRTLAVPLLYSLYEARFQIPIHAFIDRISSDTALQKGLTSIIARPQGPYCSKYDLTNERRTVYRQWARERGSQLEKYGIRSQRKLTTDECAQLELWRLTSRAPNLKVLKVTVNWSGKFAHGLQPVWLHPIALAASRISRGLENNGWFERLHTLQVNLDNECGLYLAHIFRLPCLEYLAIECVMWTPAENRIRWPNSAPLSRVHTLKLCYMAVPSSLIVQMIDWCQALQSFRGDRIDADRFLEDHLEDTAIWSAKILDSLKRHKRTLRQLYLEPDDRKLHKSWESGFDRLDLRSFDALEALEVPSMLLMGRPPGTLSNGTWSPIDDWHYPLLSDIMPPRLHTLKIDMSPEYTPGTQGLEFFFHKCATFSSAWKRL